jgi:hypothetical protein
MPVKMQRAARLREDRVNQEYYWATRMWAGSCRLTRADQEGLVDQQPAMAYVGELECPDEFLASLLRDWRTKNPFPWIGGLLCG